MIAPHHVERVLGRPRLLQGVGQLFGLGQSEQQTLRAEGLPTWALVVLALGVGAACGAVAQQRWRII